MIKPNVFFILLYAVPVSQITCVLVVLDLILRRIMRFGCAGPIIEKNQEQGHIALATQTVARPSVWGRVNLQLAKHILRITSFPETTQNTGCWYSMPGTLEECVQCSDSMRAEQKEVQYFVFCNKSISISYGHHRRLLVSCVLYGVFLQS